eukprot:4107255-Pyramimonas_sp.AAC.1
MPIPSRSGYRSGIPTDARSRGYAPRGAPSQRRRVSVGSRPKGPNRDALDTAHTYIYIHM